MKGFSSKRDIARYGHLYALSSILCNQEFWFNGELFDACWNKDVEQLRRLLIKAAPSVWQFAAFINWEELAESAIKVHDFGNCEHNALLERLDLLKLEGGTDE